MAGPCRPFRLGSETVWHPDFTTHFVPGYECAQQAEAILVRWWAGMLIERYHQRAASKRSASKPTFQRDDDLLLGMWVVAR